MENKMVQSFIENSKLAVHPAVGLVVAPIQLGLIAALGAIDKILPALQIKENVGIASAALGIFAISWLAGLGLSVMVNHPRRSHSPSPATAE